MSIKLIILPILFLSCWGYSQSLEIGNLKIVNHAFSTSEDCKSKQTIQAIVTDSIVDTLSLFCIQSIGCADVYIKPHPYYKKKQPPKENWGPFGTDGFCKEKPNNKENTTKVRVEGYRISGGLSPEEGVFKIKLFSNIQIDSVESKSKDNWRYAKWIMKDSVLQQIHYKNKEFKLIYMVRKNKDIFLAYVYTYRDFGSPLKYNFFNHFIRAFGKEISVNTFDIMKEFNERYYSTFEETFYDG